MNLQAAVQFNLSKPVATGYGVWYGGPGSGCAPHQNHRIMYFGGPGSGCNPEAGVCGRPPGGAKTDTPAESVAKKFGRYEKMVNAVANKKINGLAVFGERGIGKSKTVIDSLAKTDADVTKIRGQITPKELFNTLSANRDANSIVWFDDADSAFKDTTSLNLLKAALDSDEPREISWLSSKKEEGEEQTFQFKGRIIVTTNIDMGTNPHVAALVDRMHWINLKLTPDEKMSRIESVAPKMLSHLDSKTQKDVIDWIKQNKDEIGSNLSLRTVKKLGDLANIDPSDWKDLAQPILEEGAREAEKAAEVGKQANQTAKQVNEGETGAPVNAPGKKMPAAREANFGKVALQKGYKKVGHGHYESKKGTVKFGSQRDWVFMPTKGASKSGDGIKELAKTI